MWFVSDLGTRSRERSRTARTRRRADSPLTRNPAYATMCSTHECVRARQPTLVPEIRVCKRVYLTQQQRVQPTNIAHPRHLATDFAMTESALAASPRAACPRANNVPSRRIGAMLTIWPHVPRGRLDPVWVPDQEDEALRDLRCMHAKRRQRPASGPPPRSSCGARRAVSLSEA
jgi:hypothetical protein